MLRQPGHYLHSQYERRHGISNFQKTLTGAQWAGTYPARLRAAGCWTYLRWLAPNPEREELYDLRNDPLEAHNLAADPQHAETLAQLRARSEKYPTELK